MQYLPSKFIQTISEVQPLQPLLLHISSELEHGKLFQRG